MPGSSQVVGNSELVSDCDRCCALCCIAPPFSASEDFALDKAAGVKCPNMDDNFRCAIHSDLKTLGFRGCTVYECYGAGQKVTQITFRGRTWRENPDSATAMFDVFMKMRVIHESLMYLTEALKLGTSEVLAAGIQEKIEELESLSLQEAEMLCVQDISPHKREVAKLIDQVGEEVRYKERPVQ